MRKAEILTLSAEPSTASVVDYHPVEGSNKAAKHKYDAVNHPLVDLVYVVPCGEHTVYRSGIER